MNFIHGEIVGDTSVHFKKQENGLDIELNGDHKATLAGYRGKEVILGIRPEDLYVFDSPYVPKSVVEVDLVLDVLEPMGNEIFVYARSGEEGIVARVAPQALPNPGETIRLAMDLTKLHFFDVETEQAIGLAESEKLAV